MSKVSKRTNNINKSAGVTFRDVANFFYVSDENIDYLKNSINDANGLYSLLEWSIDKKRDKEIIVDNVYESLYSKEKYTLIAIFNETYTNILFKVTLFKKENNAEYIVCFMYGKRVDLSYKSYKDIKERIYNFILDNTNDASHILLFGFSMGGTVAQQIALEFIDNNKHNNIFLCSLGIGGTLAKADDSAQKTKIETSLFGKFISIGLFTYNDNTNQISNINKFILPDTDTDTIKSLLLNVNNITDADYNIYNINYFVNYDNIPNANFHDIADNLFLDMHEYSLYRTYLKMIIYGEKTLNVKKKEKGKEKPSVKEERVLSNQNTVVFLDKEYTIQNTKITATAYRKTITYDGFKCVLNDWRIDWNEVYNSLSKNITTKMTKHGIKIKDNALHITSDDLNDIYNIINHIPFYLIDYYLEKIGALTEYIHFTSGKKQSISLTFKLTNECEANYDGLFEDIKMNAVVNKNYKNNKNVITVNIKLNQENEESRTKTVIPLIEIYNIYKRHCLLTLNKEMESLLKSVSSRKNSTEPISNVKNTSINLSPQTCKAALSNWGDRYSKPDKLNPDIKEKCPCILLNASKNDYHTATYFGKRVTKEECNRPKNNSKNNTKNISSLTNTYEKYIWTTNTEPMYYYIYVKKDDGDKLKDIITKYLDKSKFTIQEAEKYISVSSFEKEDLQKLARDLHKYASNTYNNNIKKSTTPNIPLYPVTTAQAAGSRKKKSINKKSKTKKRIVNR